MVDRHRARVRDAKGHYVPETPPAAAPAAVDEAQLRAAPQASARRDPPHMEAPHELSSRERAAQRAAEIMGHLDGALEDGTDELSLDNIQVPDGWTYEWKRQTVYGKADPAYDTRLARTGWEVVPASRHPAMMPKGHRGEITRDGLVLMQRPEIVTNRVKQIMFERARGAVRLKEQQLNEAPQGTFERVDERGRPTARIRTSHSPVEIPVPTE
ncbi:MAG TPA: hypothetical protein VGF50_14235 [Caulobacteraceae bacterium]|jgi:hypothetical protein